MTKTISFIAMLLIYMLPTLTPVYAASHAKATDAATTEADKKKVAEEEDEEPECD
ncbi:MAG: hypothetical protein V3U64_04275 [Cocleimonas sp.]